MIRLFERHRIRTQVELDGLWEFALGGADNKLPSEYTHRLPVPGCWEMHPDFRDYRGRGVYRKKLTVKDGKGVRLVFKGVSHTADVFFDGEQVAHHHNAYTPFSVVLTDVEPGEHELAVIADNAFSDASALHVPNDYYTYGGITRPVALQYVDELFIERVAFTPSCERAEWQASIGVVVRNVGTAPATVTLAGSLGETALAFPPRRVAAGETAVIDHAFVFPGVEAWSGGNPRLYLLELQLFRDGGEEPVDDLIERVGFRTVEVSEGRLLLNGNAVFLRGFNRHEDHPFGGCAIPFALMVQDMDIMQDLGVNAVRTSHYPNDERFLDLCDERGVLVWEENHARGLDLDRMRHPAFRNQCAEVNREMVEHHYNHPSIVAWGILNECASDTKEGCAMYREQFEQIRGMDRSRPLTFASNKPHTDLVLPYVDIVSLNLYAGWYGDEDVEERLAEILGWVASAGGAGKPVIISEFGAGAWYGYRDPAQVKWSEERQQSILDRTLSVYLDRKKLTGAFIWQFCDCRVTEEEWALARPGTRNNKGVVDRYRRPKLAYAVVRDHFRRHREQDAEPAA